MKKAVVALALILAISGGGIVMAKKGHFNLFGRRAPEKALPTSVDNFRLADFAGKSYELDRYANSKAVVLFVTGNGCPIVRQSIPKLKALRDEYAPKGVTFLMLNGNASDDRASVAKEAKEFEIDIPILIDESQIVVDSLGSTRTAEVLVLTPKDWKIAYRGAMDDRFGYGAQKAQATQEWLKDALNAVLAGQPVATPVMATKGCLLDLESSTKPISYAKQVAPILEKRCLPCHEEGNVAPFAFGKYDDVRKRASMVREVIRTKRMPPWHADGAYAEYTNDRALTNAETKTLVRWADAGAPRDGSTDPLAEHKPSAPGTWELGEPDAVVPMAQAMQIPAEGVFDYIYQKAMSPLQEDVWLRAVDVQAGNRKVLHHVLIFLQYPDALRDEQPDYHGGLEGYFAGYVPGAGPAVFPEGTGKLLPKGCTFVFQLHYNATGKPEQDLTKLGLYFCKEKPKMALATRAAYTQSFTIPPGAEDHPAKATFNVDKDSILWEMSPHMHFRGSRFQYEAKYPDGRSEILLCVPHYDFNWQTMYRLKEPRTLPAGTKIVCTGAFDNSPLNPANPDATKSVRFGEQTFEEMFIGYMNISPVPQAS